MMDADFFRLRIGAMIAQGFLVDEVRGGLHLKGASEVWGGPAFDDRPAWYFWLTAAPGAYRLRLENIERVEGSATAARCVLSVKYYPSPSESVFECYGPEERALIGGGLFDNTHTPTFDAQDRIAETLFTVGGIEFVHDPACGQSLLSFSAFQRMRLDPRPNEPRTPALSHVACGGLPAWDLGYPLFEAVVGLEAFIARRGPARVILSEQSEAEGRGASSRREPLSAFKTLLAVFGPDSAAASAAEEPAVATLLGDPWHVVYDCAVPMAGHHTHHHRGAAAAGEPNGHAVSHHPCACGHHPHHDGRHRIVRIGDATLEVPLSVTDQWWVLAAADPAANAMPCGCH